MLSEASTTTKKELLEELLPRIERDARMDMYNERSQAAVDWYLPQRPGRISGGQDKSGRSASCVGDGLKAYRIPGQQRLIWFKN